MLFVFAFPIKSTNTSFNWFMNYTARPHYNLITSKHSWGPTVKCTALINSLISADGRGARMNSGNTDPPPAIEEGGNGGGPFRVVSFFLLLFFKGLSETQSVSCQQPGPFLSLSPPPPTQPLNFPFSTPFFHPTHWLEVTDGFIWRLVNPVFKHQAGG